jgi:hypothetical protein
MPTISEEPSHPYSRGARADYTWSARFSTQRPLELEEVVLGRLGRLIRGFANPEWSISGAVLGSGDNQDRTTVILGLDPSKRYGTPSLERCEIMAGAIAITQGWRREAEELPKLRIIMGRRVGYEENERTYTLEEVRDLTAARECNDLTLTEADLFSLRYVPNKGLQKYHEPGVIIAGPANNLEALLQVAGDMGQVRLVPEITDVETQVYQK